MFPKNLNSFYNYTLKGNTYVPTALEVRLIYNKNIDKSYWKKQGDYFEYRKALKTKHYFGQGRRCAYCRCELRTDAYWEDLDHIVSQEERQNWIYYPKNLIVTCEPCNRLKNDNSTLNNISIKYFPLTSKGFNIFNPHFDKWSDHFEIFNDFFLRGRPSTKGPETYKYCHLYRHDVIIANVDEQRIWRVYTMRRLTHRLKFLTKGSPEEVHLQKAIDHMLNRKKIKVNK
jgi:5-methylcytosine-specific restriction endonuclease McrA